eukprot:SAG11_NODE_3200_length_2615_cov_3.093800_1_plen_61_part_00
MVLGFVRATPNKTLKNEKKAKLYTRCKVPRKDVGVCGGERSDTLADLVSKSGFFGNFLPD